VGEALHRLDLVALGLQALHEKPNPTPLLPARRPPPTAGLTPALRKRLDALQALLAPKPRAQRRSSSGAARKPTPKQKKAFRRPIARSTRR
jgi:hypothetical protein